QVKITVMIHFPDAAFRRWLPQRLRQNADARAAVNNGVQPETSGVGLVILDEFHERSLQADLALALLLDVQQGLRDDLKLLIMS
ncbi:hypothetical protein ACSLNT_29310, partial [Escherichia coli]|uniref:hypothetical protein n=1 Tax=Escherichia coli TaxID=562 RepID=UPI003EE2065E